MPPGRYIFEAGAYWAPRVTTWLHVGRDGMRCEAFGEQPPPIVYALPMRR